MCSGSLLLPPCCSATLPPCLLHCHRHETSFGMHSEWESPRSSWHATSLRAHSPPLECAKHCTKSCASHETSRTSCTRTRHQTSRTCWRHFPHQGGHLGQGHHFGELAESLESLILIQTLGWFFGIFFLNPTAPNFHQTWTPRYTGGYAPTAFIVGSQ